MNFSKFNITNHQKFKTYLFIWTTNVQQGRQSAFENKERNFIFRKGNFH